MQNLKKSLLLLSIALVISAAAVAPAHAQAGRIKADIPFDFVLDKTTMKAGTYFIQTQGDFLSLRDDAGATRYVLALPGDKALLRNGQPYLRFNRYGNESFLSQIVFAEKNTVRLPQSGREKELEARSTTGDQIELRAGASR